MGYTNNIDQEQYQLKDFKKTSNLILFLPSRSTFALTPRPGRSGSGTISIKDCANVRAHETSQFEHLFILLWKFKPKCGGQILSPAGD